MNRLRRLVCLFRDHSWLWLYGPDGEPVCTRCRRCGLEIDRPESWFVAQLRGHA